MKLKKALAILIAFCMVMGIISSSFAEPTEDFHVEQSTEPTEAAKGPVVEEYMVYTDDDKRIEPGSLTGDVNLSTVGKGLYFDGTDFYFFLDTGIMANNFMYNIQGDRFFFGEDGKMVKDQLITYDGELYYFDVNGAMYKNRWYSAEEIDTYENTITYTDYYFGPTGRAYRAGDNSQGLIIKTIEGEKFGFNSDGEKVEGYYDHSGTKYEADEVEAYANCEYYFDPEENGAATTGWHYYSGSVRGDEYDDNEEIVLYFDEKTCKKVRSVSSDETRCVARTIEGQRYMFDYNGVRKNKWYTTDPNRPASNSNARYFSEDYDGYLTKGWFTAIPPENSLLEINRKRHENSEDVWYYAGTNGNIYKKCIRKIGAYTYAFDDDGVMQEDCLVRVKNGAFVRAYKTENLYKGNVLNDPNEYGEAEPKGSTSDPLNLDKTKGLLYAGDGEQWMYFMGDQKGEDKIGAMAPLNTPYTIELNDEDVYFVANSTGGYTLAEDTDMGKIASVATRNNKYIQNGCLLKPNPDDNNYGIIRLRPKKYSEETVYDWKNVKHSTRNVPQEGPWDIYEYRVVNSTGGLVSGNYKCIKDKQGNYIYYGLDGKFIGYYSCQGRCTIPKADATWESKDKTETHPIYAGEPYWEYKEDKDWKWGLPPKENRVKIDYVALNFGLSGSRLGCEGPYEDGLAALVYSVADSGDAD